MLSEGKNMVVRFPVLLRTAGIVAMIFGIIGLLAGFFSMMSLSVMSSAKFTAQDLKHYTSEVISRLPSESRQEAASFDASRLQKIMATKEFKRFAYGMSTFDVIFNLLMIFLSFQLANIRVEGILPFLILMLIFCLYITVFPWVMVKSHLAMPFSAAWGVGNMGVSLVFITYFWLWGPAVVVFSRGWKRA